LHFQSIAIFDSWLALSIEPRLGILQFQSVTVRTDRTAFRNNSWLIIGTGRNENRCNQNQYRGDGNPFLVVDSFCGHRFLLF